MRSLQTQPMTTPSLELIAFLWSSIAFSLKDTRRCRVMARALPGFDCPCGYASAIPLIRMNQKAAPSLPMLTLCSMPTDAIGIYKSATMPYFLQASFKNFKKSLDAFGNTILANHSRPQALDQRLIRLRTWTLDSPPEN